MHRKGGQGRTQCACRRVSRADLLRRRRSGGAGAAGPPRAEGCEHPWAPPHLQSRPRSAPRSDMPLGSKPQLSRLSNSAFFSQVKICPKKQAARRLLAPRPAHLQQTYEALLLPGPFRSKSRGNKPPAPGHENISPCLRLSPAHTVLCPAHLPRDQLACPEGPFRAPTLHVLDVGLGFKWGRPAGDRGHRLQVSLKRTSSPEMHGL